MTEPCSAEVTDSMIQLHRMLVEGVGVTSLITLGILLDRLRLMWGDYRKRHRINGGD